MIYILVTQHITNQYCILQKIVISLITTPLSNEYLVH